MTLERIVRESMGGLPDFENYELVWGVAVDLTVDTIKRITE
jgi:hypothetical protein